MSDPALDLRRPFGPAEAESLFRTAWGIDARAQALAGELDQNFLMTAADGGRHVLKLYHAGADAAVLDFQDGGLLHLADRDPSLPAPRPVPAQDGRLTVPVAMADGSTRLARVLDWLPGRLMGESRPYGPALLRSLGAYLGRLDRALADFSHPAQDRPLRWAITAAPQARELLPHVADPARRAKAERILDRYDERVVPLLPGLRRQVVHHDANDWNVVVGPDGLCAGVIDFGDAVANPLVAELAVACAYAMMGQDRPVEAVLPLVAGYHAANPLTADELSVLLDLIRARLAQSVCMSSWQHARDPGNDYLLISQKDAWALIDQLDTVNDAFAAYKLRAAAGLPAHPASRRVLAWLAANADRIGPICRHDLTVAENVVVLDWTQGSADLTSLDGLDSVDAKTEVVLARIARAGAQVGIGRYAEPRGVYQTDAFKTDTGERRTIHLGIDVFLPADEPFLAPLPGRVHLVTNNAQPGDYGPLVILEHETGDGDVFYTLYGHLADKTLTHLKAGDRVETGDVIGWNGAPPTNGDWVPHLHFQFLLDLMGRGADIEGVGRRSDMDVWESVSPDPNAILGIPAEVSVRLPRGHEALLEQRRLHLGRSLSVSYAEPLKIVAGEGQYLIDETGTAYLDMVNNVAHVGHCHPRVVAAGQGQMAALNTNTRYLHDNIVDFARRLTATLPDSLSVCVFVNSGSEANDLALRMARAATGRTDTVAVDVAYHGNLNSLVAISPYKFDGPGGKGRPEGTWVAEMPDGYRGRLKYGEPELGARYAEDVARQFAAAAKAGRGVAAFIAESILSCGGQIVLPDGYLKAAYAHARAAGALCIADEVQVGFGRVGSHMWAFETQGVTPDIVTMGKPIGNGHPIGAVVTTPEIAAAFANGMEYFNTFGGNPVSSAIGIAVLDVIRDERLQAKARRVGERMLAGMRALQAKHPLIGDVRGLGQFTGFELVRDRATLEPAKAEAKQLVEGMKRRRILLSIDGPLYNVIKIKPPMAFGEADCDRFLAALDEVLAEIG
ncbi:MULTISPECIES: aminotransferase class III-fold pyridoxal phosphate-dependent enzyme [Inquilinus]|uniref:4-aminobutyrate aminotransferase-like enzyme/Ser/Thr protein kinase RdoA (MazF antagonist) n=1 Tax=Inquilinus ginsengisoli TaxID=363840 RepID=A0ABU1JZY4_9PROT|nr:aminotransferase class III-fold pyridoxal phosphate-dependent enzyme [Inquilinus ginsengisoli]MDR6294190.1 4-aminobutyrate aminotransferase-like enzyme/Ser/Thr protein kinase RdoA (MazF antagonist) [Inquilinus ginsengisoli]